MSSIWPQPVHILGLGSLGKLIAHSLRLQHPETPIVLLFHRPNLIDQWDKAEKCIEVVRDGVSNQQNGFSYEIVSQERSPIRNLIVTTKTYATVQALKPLKDRLEPSSTLLFLQNGMGTIDEVNLSLLDEPPRRPNYMAGVVNHGVYATGPFSIVHAGVANMTVGSVLPLPTDTLPQVKQKEIAFLKDQLRDTPTLDAVLVSPAELLYAQFEKLAANAIINPLTAIFDYPNGRLFHNAATRALIRALVYENSRSLFSPQKLEEIASGVCARTASNSSSMRQDFRAGRRTEIDYINGYIIARGAESGIDCVQHKKLVKLVEEKSSIAESQIPEVFEDIEM